MSDCTSIRSTVGRDRSSNQEKIEIRDNERGLPSHFTLFERLNPQLESERLDIFSVNSSTSFLASEARASE